MAVAVFNTNKIVGTAVAQQKGRSIQLKVEFVKLPAGPHGFHIHTAGDLRAAGCQGACSHWHKGPAADHGDFGHGHTGDLGNIELVADKFKKTYIIHGCCVEELWGRTLIIHEDEDDLGLGDHDDSKTTGHSGARIGCAIFGRLAGCQGTAKKTRKRKH